MTSSGTGASFLLLLALVMVVATSDYYVPPPTTHTPSQPYVPPATFTSPVKTPYLPKPNTEIAIEGLIFCKSGNETYPLQVSSPRNRLKKMKLFNADPFCVLP
ncbi:hypothetical protein DY000_02036140 [Brassica cretica]|uniref:Uncharacterized protein n=1 Tax=Brassica cretica TaxID=69181 RepID=A0ABQ7DS12_BRACR|nr:hypothetical protein DY000_02036140 [Brassica cretica]